MKPILLAAILGLALLLPAHGATKQPLVPAGRTAPSAVPLGASYRFLFLVDTSSGMAARKDALTNAVCEIIRSSFSGRVKPGDVFGTWTFSDQLRTNGLSPDIWFPDARDHYAERAAWFLRGQKFDKTARLDSIIPKLAQAESLSGNVTIFLLTDGLSRIAGTPYDNEINQVFLEHGRELASEKRPFLILLQSDHHQITFWAVYPAAGRIELPPSFAAAPSASATTDPKPAAPKPAPAANAEPPKERAVPTPSAVRTTPPSRPPAPKPEPPPAATPAPELSVPQPAEIAEKSPASAPASTTMPSAGEHSAPPEVPTATLAPAPEPHPAPAPAPATAVTHSNSTPTLATVEPTTPRSFTKFILFGVVVLGAAATFMWMRFSRRPGRQSSLISQSIDHQP